MLTNVKKRDIISVVMALAVTQRIPRSAVTFSIMFEEVEIFLFPSSMSREVIPMYMTWEMFFQFCTVIIAMVGLIVSIFNKKK